MAIGTSFACRKLLQEPPKGNGLPFLLKTLLGRLPERRSTVSNSQTRASKGAGL